MKLSKKFKIVKWSILILCFFICVIGLTVYAKTSEPTVKKIANSNATKCTKEYVKTTYNPKVTTTIDGDNISIKVKLESVANDIAFWYFLYDPVNNMYVKENTAILAKETSISFVRTNKATEYINVLVATTKNATISKTADNECSRVEYDRAKNIADYYASNLKFEGFTLKDGEYATAITSMVEDPLVDESSELESNSSYNGVCKDFRESNKAGFASQSNSFKELFDNYAPNKVGESIYKNNYLKYCYSENVKIDYPKKDVLQMIENALTEVSIDKEIDAVISNGSLTLESSLAAGTKKFDLTAKGWETVKEVQSLTCDKFATSNKQTYYATEKTVTNNASGSKCIKQCEEVVTVEYDPPQATKAGLCFEYEVTVTSKVNCKTEFTGTKPQKSDYEVCKIYPICNDSSNYYDQAGPNEEFDSCVLDCDGGEYSQSCINKCYKKVYENEKYIELNFNSKYTVKQLASLISNESINCTNENADALREEILESETCKYKYNGNKIVWSCPSDAKYWEKLGRYYFETRAKARQTVKAISSYSVGNNYQCTENRNGRNYRYYIDEDGFKRWCGNYSASTEVKCKRGCNQACSWHIKGTCNPKSNAYYSSGKAGVINTTHDFLNNSDLEKDYAAALKTYKEEAKACKNEEICSKSSSTFTISVNNGNLTDPFSLKAEVSEKGTISGDETIILKTDGTCYGKSDPYQSLVTWGIPGTWINNKTGNISYKVPNNKTGWSYKKNKFCTLLNSTNVNEKWWKWKLVQDEENKRAAEEESTNYNITANAKEFGKYKFNINIQCFYAISEPKIESGPINYRIRSVDTKDLFPNEEGNATLNPESTGRTPGFNWSSDAKNDKNSNYIIDPPSLITKIQSTNDTYNSSNLDYEFELDRKSLNKIKNIKNNFTDFGNEFTTETGLYTYKSNIINNPSNFYKSTLNRKIGCNNYSKTTNSCE